ncbi:Asp23/Gls24 family envelope stress response protein [Streptomyces sp. NPDC005805]|uniref:Asp23/Gls24 family envelope stress response protein n=1 Tax=Streptomyces sp. NPDC005805 TaxID=3157068 RepID=UPI0033E16452
MSSRNDPPDRMSPPDMHWAAPDLTSPPDTHRGAPVYEGEAPVHEDEARLDCGRLLADVWYAVEQRDPDTHRSTCPHCTAAAEEFTRLESAAGRLREETATVPDADASSLTERVMDVVRLELRPGRPVPLGEPDEELSVVEAAAARVLRAAAETVPGVRAGSCRLVPEGARGGPGVLVRLDVHAPTHAVLPGIAEEVRSRVLAAADRRLGLTAPEVDVRITDLTDAPGRPAHGPGDPLDGPGPSWATYEEGRS